MGRGVWLDPGGYAALGGREGVLRMVDRMVRAHVQVLMAPCVHEGWTLYPDSALAPQLPAFQIWSGDPLQVLIDAATEADVEVHAWVWVFAAGCHQRLGPVLQAHPEWAELSRDGALFSPKSGYSWLNPAMPEVRDHLQRQFDEILDRYRVAGLHLDYVRYCQRWEADFGFSDFTRAIYRERTGIDPADLPPMQRGGIAANPEAREFELWREENVTSFVDQLGDRVRGRVPLSAAVFSDIRGARRMALQNWAAWVRQGMLDFLCPMSYTADTEEFAKLMGEAVGAAALSAVPVYSGIGIRLEPTVFDRQLQLVRRFNPDGGEMIFSLVHLREDDYAVLERNP